MNFKNENIAFLRSFIECDLCIKVNDHIIECVSTHPIVLWHSNNHTLNLKVLALTNNLISCDLYDVVGLALVRMCWPKKEDIPEYHALFGKLINKKLEFTTNLIHN
jgi:hypothetical protein